MSVNMFPLLSVDVHKPYMPSNPSLTGTL